MRLIQTPVADRPECVTALNVAFSIAKQTGANVKGIHVRTHRAVSEKGRANSRFLQGWMDAVDWTNMSEEEAQAKEQSASALFSKLAAKNGFELRSKEVQSDHPLAFWYERLGTPQHVMPIIGPTADMMVVSRPAQKNSQKAKIFMMEALMTSHRPVLIVPSKSVPSIGRKIAIAWNGSREAASVVHNAIPLLKTAESVTFITVGGIALGPNANQMIKYLKHHKVSCEKPIFVQGNPEDELEKACDACGADLLAMGAYSRHRISELLFGGVTQHMIFNTKRPVLLRHF